MFFSKCVFFQGKSESRTERNFDYEIPPELRNRQQHHLRSRPPSDQVNNKNKSKLLIVIVIKICNKNKKL